MDTSEILTHEPRYAIHDRYAMIFEASNKAVAVSSRLKPNVRGMESEWTRGYDNVL
jgi:hypothetical protein